MNEMKKRLEEEMREIVLPEHFGEETVRAAQRGAAKKTYKFPAAAAALLAIVLAGTVSFAGYLIHQKITINEKELPQMEAMKVREHRAIEEPGISGTEYENYRQLREAIGTPLLDTEYANDIFQKVYYYKSPEEDYEQIRVQDYIPDVQDGEYVTGDEHTLTTVSMKIYIVLEESALDQKLDDEYVGDFSFVEQYRSQQGYTVNVISMGGDPEYYIMLFVVDGVRYELTGIRELDEMKQIVDSMKYFE